MELILVRHGLPIRREVTEGAADPELSVDGVAQAEHFANYMAIEHIDAIYSSPMKRAVQTAEPLARLKSMTPVLVDGVAEFDQHSNEYIPVEELKANNDPRWKELVEGGYGLHEDPTEFNNRVFESLEKIINENRGGRVVVTCHGGVINSYLSRVLNLPSSQGQFFYPNYTSIHRIAASSAGHRSILSVNETSHLRGTGLPIDSSMAENIEALIDWLDVSPTPFHVVATAQHVLNAAGFIQQQGLTHAVETNGYLIKDGSIVAWRKGTKNGALRIIGAHTDSPNLRVQANPDISQHGWAQLGVEIYGGVLLNSWLDRDLGIAGRVIDRDGQIHLFNVNEALARVPQLAIHLDREIGERGLFLDKHQHSTPIWGINAPNFAEWVAEVSGAQSVAAFDAHLYDVSPATILGVDESILVSARLDNQASCWAAINALAAIENAEHTVVVVLNDHEEVGSESVTGAGGPLLASLLAAIDRDHGLSDGAVFDMRSRSWCLSADNAHAVHPNYAERHDPRHGPRPNNGPALKLNGNQRYATTVKGAAFLRTIAERNEIPLQVFMSRNNMPCGSTIGPITSTQLGIEAIDIGISQLSMHSAREMCGAEDPEYLVALMSAFAQS